MKESYRYLLCEVKKLAVDSFETFIKRLGLNPNLFEHLHDIKYSIGKTLNDGAHAEYYEDDNELVISEKIVQNGLKKVHNEEIYYEELVENLAISYLHEMLHANRTIIIGNLLNKRNYDEFTYKQKYNNEHSAELIKYKYALDKVLINYDINDFVGSIPIIVHFNQDKTYFVVAYNDKDKSFEIYEHQKFNVKLKNIDSFLMALSKELIQEKSKHPINKVVYDYFDYNDVVALPCDYYRFDSNIRLNIKNVKLFKKFEKRINSQLSFEEIITEALAVIMVYTRNDNIIDFESLKEYSYDENVYAGIKIIKSFDLDTLRWYFLSTYDEVYCDKFSKFFNDKYIDLLKIMYKIYELNMPLSKELDNELKYILKKSKQKTYFLK